MPVLPLEEDMEEPALYQDRPCRKFVICSCSLCGGKCDKDFQGSFPLALQDTQSESNLHPSSTVPSANHTEKMGIKTGQHHHRLDGWGRSFGSWW